LPGQHGDLNLFLRIGTCQPEPKHSCRRKNCRVPSPRHDERSLSRIERHCHVGGTRFNEAGANRTRDSRAQLSAYEALQSVTFSLKQPVFIEFGTKIRTSVRSAAANVVAPTIHTRDRQRSEPVAIPRYRPIRRRLQSALQWRMPELTRQKITFAEMRAAGVRGLLVYCSDYKCSH
jgi:hypothetical protein